MTDTMKTVGSDFPAQLLRARELLDAYHEIGPVGAFGAAVIQQTIASAQAAWESGDVVRILQAYEALRGLA